MVENKSLYVYQLCWFFFLCVQKTAFFHFAAHMKFFFGDLPNLNFTQIHLMSTFGGLYIYVHNCFR